MEELRSEMLEMRDMYMEEDVYQLQELRQQLEQVRVQADERAKWQLISHWICVFIFCSLDLGI